MSAVGRGPTADIPFVKTKKQDYLQKYSEQIAGMLIVRGLNRMVSAPPSQTSSTTNQRRKNCTRIDEESSHWDIFPMGRFFVNRVQLHTGPHVALGGGAVGGHRETSKVGKRSRQAWTMQRHVLRRAIFDAHILLLCFQDLRTNLIVPSVTPFVLPSASTRTGLIPPYFSMLPPVLGDPESTHLLPKASQLINSGRRDLINADRASANTLQGVIRIESKGQHHSFLLAISEKERSSVIEHLLIRLCIMQLILKDEVSHTNRVSLARKRDGALPTGTGLPF